MANTNVPESDITVFDSGTTTFDRAFRFTVRAQDFAALSQIERTFTIKIDDTTNKVYSNLYMIALMKKNKRLDWFNFITDVSIFVPDTLYRYGDPNYGIQSQLKILIYAGIESKAAINYVQALSRNHYNKRLTFGDIKVAKGKDPVTQETLYEVIYVDVVDALEVDGKRISEVIELKDNINSKVIVSYDSIKVDSDIPFVSDSDHQRIFPNSIRNMRNRIKAVGERDREFLPLWMRSIQDTGTYELGFTKALTLCYCKPGRSSEIIAKIKARNFDFKILDFEADRFVIDILDNNIEDKYLVFPQRGEKLP